MPFPASWAVARTQSQTGMVFAENGAPASCRENQKCTGDMAMEQPGAASQRQRLVAGCSSKDMPKRMDLQLSVLLTGDQGQWISFAHGFPRYRACLRGRPGPQREQDSGGGRRGQARSAKDPVRNDRISMLCLVSGETCWRCKLSAGPVRRQ